MKILIVVTACVACLLGFGIRAQAQGAPAEHSMTGADAYRQIVEVVGYSRRELLGRMIAARALVHRATLVTLKASDFRDVPGLELLSW